jgi:hypothetical protein
LIQRTNVALTPDRIAYVTKTQINHTKSHLLI